MNRRTDGRPDKKKTQRRTVKKKRKNEEKFLLTPKLESCSVVRALPYIIFLMNLKNIHMSLEGFRPLP